MNALQKVEFDKFAESIKAYDPEGLFRNKVENVADPTEILRTYWDKCEGIVSMMGLRALPYIRQAVIEIFYVFDMERSYTTDDLATFLLALQRFAVENGASIQFEGQPSFTHIAEELGLCEPFMLAEVSEEFFQVVDIADRSLKTLNFEVMSYGKYAAKWSLSADEQSNFDKCVSSHIGHLKTFLELMEPIASKPHILSSKPDNPDEAYAIYIAVCEWCLGNHCSKGELAACFYLASMWLVTQGYYTLWREDPKWDILIGNANIEDMDTGRNMFGVYIAGILDIVPAPNID